ncbi:LamG-like jellyroll fold domain-containing protein [Georgenia daeguensis]|uniref:LamG-like jellyroll fold domain-containing protein n=1 Tax=Georgenia daeguensis TaxID=908355 RepID=A0ABP6UK41_9MICO
MVAALALALGIVQPAGAGEAPTAEVAPGGVAAAPDAAGAVPGSDVTSPAEISGASGTVVAPNFSPTAGPEAPDVVATSLWWRWTAPSTGTYRLHTHGSELDTVLTVSTGTAGALREVRTNDDAGSVVTSELTLPAKAGTSYLIEVETRHGPGLVTLAWSGQGAAASQGRGGAPDSGSDRTSDPGAILPGPTATALAVDDGVPVSVNTGEKPQSKLWRHDGTWWAVLASTDVSPAGTWLWRYDGGRWTNVLRLSADATLRADTKRVGNVTHILLHGPSPVLVSVEYVPGTRTYQPWAARPTATPVSLSGSETATIDIDSTGRMWLASDSATSVEVRYADAPYRSFSSRTVLASNITEDDIAVVTAMPGGKIGVLWSNQSTRRFGFRTHTDGASPSTWGSDEVPASQSALNVGGGMADDHLNVAVASDGTLYAAVKTSYNRSDRPVIGLLVRRPSGSWDNLREVDNIGTRGIVQLDETAGTLRVIYTESTNFDDILMKTASTRDLVFSDSPTTAMDGNFNNVTGTKENVAGARMIMASSVDEAYSTLIGTGPTPEPDPEPSAPVVADGSVSTTQDTAVSGTLRVVSSSGGPLVFEVVTAPRLGTVTLTDAATGAFRYVPAAGALGQDSFTFRVRDGALWSEPGTMSVTITAPAPAPTGVRGQWLMEEGAGTTVGDSSGWGNHGTVQGSVAWGPGRAGSGLVLDGTGGYVRVPDSASLDLSGPMTVAAWVRPQVLATQYVVKKATNGTRDGFELSLSSTGRGFFRVNEATSDDRYRVNATSVHPLGTWVHLAGTYDGTTMRFYVDGVLQGSVAGPSAVATNGLALGIGAEPGGYRKFRGGLDEVRVYDRALTAQEIGGLAGR